MQHWPTKHEAQAQLSGNIEEILVMCELACFAEAANLIEKYLNEEPEPIACRH